MSTFKPLAKVVSVCSKKDIETWSVACRHIVRHIAAKEYLIVVPDSELEVFRLVTCAPYKVLPESFYVGALKSRLKDLLPAKNHDRIGWYLQQFIKIAAAKESLQGDDLDQIALIWDADTVPLKDLSFISEEDKVSYYYGSESHEPYFAFIKKIFPWALKQRFSFIAQCFPAKISWLQSFCEDLELEGHSWIESIVDSLDQSQRAGFSEYETLGTYIWSKHSDQVVLNHHPWERNGYSLIGKPTHLNKWVLAGLAQYFDYISFEAWDVRTGFRAPIKAWFKSLKFSVIGRSHFKTINKYTR